jgi:hypothetical protein
MKKLLATFGVAAGLAFTMLITACTQMPTEKQGVSDMRPQLSFKAGNEQAKAAAILVDGLPMGAVGDYLEGIAALRIVSGTHVLTVVLGSQVLLEQKFYIGDGVNRTFIIQ